MIYIERAAAYLPPATVTVREMSGELGLTPAQLRVLTRFLGLDRVAVAQDLELADMLCAAGQDALEGVDRDSVRYLIHAHTVQQVAPGRTGLLDEVRSRLGLRGASALSLSHLNCVAGLHALDVARALLAGASPADRVLVLVGDKAIDHQSRLIPDTTVQGDAAAACLVSAGPGGDRVAGRALKVVGRFYQGLSGPPELLDEYKKIYLDCLSDVMREAIEDAKCVPADISLVLPGNVNQLGWKRMLEKVGLPAGRVYLDNVSRTGHCYSSDPFINLVTARADGRLQAGQLVLLATAGLGATFAATVIEIGEGEFR
jgi:3-oxoacyl-[acyl-carrier-protein] synthase-3